MEKEQGQTIENTIERLFNYLKYNKNMEVDFEREQKNLFKNKILLYKYLPSYILESNDNILDAVIITTSVMASHMPNVKDKSQLKIGTTKFITSYYLSEQFSDQHKDKIITKLATLRNKNDVIVFLIKYILPYCSDIDYKTLAKEIACFNPNVLNKWVRNFYQKANTEV